MPEERDTYRISLDGTWSLEDLYTFPRTFEQVYFLVHSLSNDLDEREREKIRQTYSAFPWQGGYSAVSFYNNLKWATPRQRRPKIQSIEYSSPGWLELSAILVVAYTVSRIVSSTASAIQDVNKTYSEIIRGMQERKLMRLKISREQLKLTALELEFVEQCAARMARALGFKGVANIHRITGHPYRSLKILLSLFRRVRILVEYQRKGKAKLPDDDV